MGNTEAERESRIEGEEKKSKDSKKVTGRYIRTKRCLQLLASVVYHHIYHA